MVSLPPFRMLGGLNTTPMEAGPDEFVSVVNLHAVNGVLSKRPGMKATGQVGQYVTGPSSAFAGWGANGADPPSVSAADIAPSDVNHDDLYIGCDSKMYQVHIYGDVENTGLASTPYGDFEPLHDKAVQYWNGSAWTDISVGDLQRKFTQSGVALIAPYTSVKLDGTAGGIITNNFLLRLMIQPPTDWVTSTIATKTKFWMRILNATPQSGFWAGPTTNVNAASCALTVAEHPVLNLLYFKDRRGTRHEFRVYLYSSTELRYELDGANLTPSDSLQPDGTSKMFGPTTRVWATYDAATDRIIGFVEGHVWFFAIATGNGEIYALAADGVGTNTGYQSVLGGLRTVIPVGNISATYDNRIFTANGNTVVYSSPNIYKDVWPNDNEIFIQDAGGNITGMAAVGGVLAIFKRNTIWVAQSDGTADGYTAWPLPGNVGCVAPRSIAVAGNECWFLAEDGIYVFDGQNVTKTSEKINGFIGQVAAGPSAASAIGVWYSQVHQYRLFYSSSRSNPWLLDSAIYCVKSDGKVTFWPQGRRNRTNTAEGRSTHATDYGFQATCVASDNTPDVNRVMLGDRYGCIWEMDKGLYDGTTPVTFESVGQRIDLGTAQKLLVRWVTPTQPTLTALEWSMDVVVDGDTSNAQSLTFTPQGELPDEAFLLDNAAQFDGGVYPNSQDRQVLRSGSIAAFGRFVQLNMSDEVPAPWQLDAVELEVQKFGRRG